MRASTRTARLLGRAARFAAAVGLAPAAAATLYAAARALFGLAGARSAAWFLAGLAAYPLLHAATSGLGLDGLRRFFYVAGHELTHAAAAWLSGYRVRRIKVGAEGGHVDLSRSNAFVALAPYVVPAYALAVVVGWRLWLWRAGAAAPAAMPPAFLAALGAALSFHWVFTFHALWSVEQPDLAMAGGAAFSVVLIALGNGTALLLALKCLFPRLISLSDAGRLAWAATRGSWLTAARAVAAGLKK